MRAALGVYTKCFASWPKVQEREGRGGEAPPWSNGKGVCPDNGRAGLSCREGGGRGASLA